MSRKKATLLAIATVSLFLQHASYVWCGPNRVTVFGFATSGLALYCGLRRVS
jgi:hypothetical protein